MTCSDLLYLSVFPVCASGGVFVASRFGFAAGAVVGLGGMILFGVVSLGMAVTGLLTEHDEQPVCRNRCCRARDYKQLGKLFRCGCRDMYLQCGPQQLLWRVSEGERTPYMRIRWKSGWEADE